MKKKLFTKSYYMLLLGLFLASCSNTNNPSLDEYVTTLNWKDNFTVCVFNDVHLSVQSNLEEEFTYLENTLYARAKFNNDMEHKENYKPDLLVLNGDIFMDANKETVNRFFNFIDSLDVPFAYTYGNHDLQGQYSATFLNRVVTSKKNSVVKNPKDNVFGDSNYVVNIKDNDKLKWQMYFFDSNTYKGFSYDTFHQDQIDWYTNQIKKVNPDTSSWDKVIPSMSFFHIPTEEFSEAWKKIGNNSLAGKDESTNSVWYMEEGKVAHGNYSSTLYETMQELNSTLSMSVAHDHINVTDFYYDKANTGHPIRLIFGLKTGRGIYHNKKIMGACFYTLSGSEKKFDLLRLGVDYENNVTEISDDYLLELGGKK